MSRKLSELLWFECTGNGCQQMAADEAVRKYGVGEP